MIGALSALIPVALILAALALIFRRQLRLSRNRAKFDLQILALEMRNLEHTAHSATPLWRRRKQRSPSAPVAPARRESQSDLMRTPHALTRQAALTKLKVPTKVPDLEVRTEISADAALADAGCATLASSALDTDTDALRTHPTRRIRRVRRSRNLNNPHDEGRDGKHTSRIPVSFEYTSNTPLPKASAI